MENILNQIKEIIIENSFKKSLERINSNYPNLKQENLLRNAILELYNDKYSDEQNRAFAEHPRIKKESTDDSKRKSSSRVDLSIVNLNVIEDKENPYKIEFKHHFTKHGKDFLNYYKSIKNEFEVRESNMFILVVQTMDVELKKKYDEQWKITTKQHENQSKKTDWMYNLQDCFNFFPNTNLYTTEISIELPYPTTYYFYILTRK